jgi:hypothetical protein
MRWPRRDRPQDRSRTEEARGSPVPVTATSGPPPPVAARPDQPVTETSPETACRNAGRLPNVNAAGVTQRSQARRSLDSGRLHCWPLVGAFVSRFPCSALGADPHWCAGRGQARPVGSGLLAGRGLRVAGGVCGCVSSGRYGVTACPGGPFHALAGWASVRAAMAGWRRSLARQRLRLGPMLPAGMPSWALISV